MISTKSEDWRRLHDYNKVYEYLHDFVGVTKKQKVMDDLCDFLYMAKLDWAYNNRTKFSPEVCLVTVCEPSTQEILDLGGTLPGDIFTDQFGSVLAAMLTAGGNSATFTLKDTANVTQTISLTQTTANKNYFNLWVGSTRGCFIQLGSGSTAPARADIKIQTAFGTSPESASFAVGTGSYGAGTIATSGTITSGGSGTINEAVMLQGSTEIGTAGIVVCVCHDSTTGTAFTAGKAITCQYSWTD